MSNDGLIIENMDLSHIHLAVWLAKKRTNPKVLFKLVELLEQVRFSGVPDPILKNKGTNTCI